MAYSKVILNGTTLIDVTQKTVDASNLLSGYTALKNDGTNVTGTYEPPTVSLQAKTNIAPSTSSQTITPDQGYDGLSSVQINAMPQAEYSVPTYKTISNHSVTFNGICNVTTAGYIAAGAHSGSTDVVTAASLVSGTLDVTDNGIVDVTNYQYANVNVSGGGGGVETMLVSDIYASGMIYYTDENMTPQSGYQITGLYLPSGTLILVYNNGPAPFPSQPTGVTEIARYGSEIKGQYIVYSVLTMAHGGSND